jgi:hypothetical protein
MKRLLALFVLLCLTCYCEAESFAEDASYSEKHLGRSISNDKEAITCFVNYTSRSDLFSQSKIIKHSSPHKESKSMKFTFNNIHSKAPKMESTGAYGSTYSASLITLFNTNKAISMIEIMPSVTYLSIYTINKATGTFSWSKQYLAALEQDPVITQAMGYCY